MKRTIYIRGFIQDGYIRKNDIDNLFNNNYISNGNDKFANICSLEV